MSFPLSSNNLPLFQDTGQGASDRLASWMAWTADPSPMLAPDTTIILRQDDFAPMLDGISQGLGGGAISGGDNAFYLEGSGPPVFVMPFTIGDSAVGGPDPIGGGIGAQFTIGITPIAAAGIG